MISLPTALTVLLTAFIASTHYSCVWQLRSAYHRIAMKIHPDKLHDCPDATKAFQALIRAHSLITNPNATGYDSDDSREAQGGFCPNSAPNSSLSRSPSPSGAAPSSPSPNMYSPSRSCSRSAAAPSSPGYSTTSRKEWRISCDSVFCYVVCKGDGVKLILRV